MLNREQQAFVRDIETESRTPYLSSFWRNYVVAEVVENPSLISELSLLNRRNYLQENIGLAAADGDDEFGSLCSRLRPANESDVIAELVDVPTDEAFTPDVCFEWAVRALSRGDRHLALYILCSFWTFPDTLTSPDVDKVAFRMLRYLIQSRNQSEMPVRFVAISNELTRFFGRQGLRVDVDQLLAPDAGLQCLPNFWKQFVSKLIDRKPGTWLRRFRANNLSLIERYVEPYACNSDEVWAGFSRICESIDNVDDLQSLQFFAGNPGTVLDRPELWLESAQSAFASGDYDEALFSSCCYLAGPTTIHDVADIESAAMNVVIGSIRRLWAGEHLNTQVRRSESTGLSWQNDTYASHESICPICNRGAGYDTGEYAVEVRGYFSTSGTPFDLNRQLINLRIKCSNPCTVGTGDVSGLFLVSNGNVVNWPVEKTREYLKQVRSPLLCSFEKLLTFAGKYETTE